LQSLLAKLYIMCLLLNFYFRLGWKHTVVDRIHEGQWQSLQNASESWSMSRFDE